MASQISQSLHVLANPTKAVVLQRFFKTGIGEYGEGDKFLGITVPEIRKVVKKYWDSMTLGDAVILLKSPWHEERLAALLVLVGKFKTGSQNEKKKVYTTYLKSVKRFVNNWDLVDLTAPRIVGAYLVDKPRTPLYQLAQSKNLWERRVAILSTFQYVYQGDSDDTIKIAKILLNDKHDLIHKAVGWMLREVGKRCSIKTLEDFLKSHASKMPRTMLRYSIEKLPLKRRKFWLAR